MNLPDLFASPLVAAVMIGGLAVGALARGYSGFGMSALIVASWSLVTDPARAVALSLLLEIVASLIQAASVWKLVPWRRVGLLMAGALIGSPIGVWLLAVAPRDPLKLAIALFVLLASLAMLGGARLAHRAGPIGTAAVGAVSGAANGAVAMGGLPVALFLIADGDSPARLRASVIAYFFLLDLLGIALLAGAGLADETTLLDAAFALPILAVGLWLGGRGFAGATPDGFRRTTLWLLLGLAVIGIARTVYTLF